MIRKEEGSPAEEKWHYVALGSTSIAEKAESGGQGRS